MDRSGDSTTDLDLVLRHIADGVPQPWPEWGGGYPDDIESCLVDAVLSVRSRYGQPWNGVRGSVSRWREHRSWQSDDLTRLAEADPTELAVVLGNRQKLNGRLKAEVIQEAAVRLLGVGVRRASEVDPLDVRHRDAWTHVRGLRAVTFRYFLMLLGRPGIKADTWIIRFVSDAVGRRVSAGEAEQFLDDAARALDVDATLLDHAVWQSMRRARL